MNRRRTMSSIHKLPRVWYRGRRMWTMPYNQARMPRKANPSCRLETLGSDYRREKSLVGGYTTWILKKPVRWRELLLVMGMCQLQLNRDNRVWYKMIIPYFCTFLNIYAKICIFCMRCACHYIQTYWKSVSWNMVHESYGKKVCYRIKSFV